MVMTAIGMLHNIQGAKVAYTQSDEISILLTDYDTITTDAWFGYNVQKICSISASMCTSLFNTYYNLYKSADVLALFDSRVFNIPKEEVMNYFLWRQQDWIRNSVQMCAQHVYSQKQLNGVNIETQKEMLKSSVFNWDDLPLNWKYGTFVSKHRGVDHINQSHEAVLENKNMFDEYLNM
jgi:tRNA(His) 5'-end guanylyltransferase